VTWADTDSAQVVHYSNYFRLFERAEEDFYRSLGFSFTDFRAEEIWFLNQETSELIATGYVIVVAANRQEGKATQIPSEFRDKLKPFLK
jgi:acyl-CoA thioesterase FadM